MMKCIVTAGPTFEPLDEVRRLTNFSTGRLGSCLADYLQERMPQARTHLLRGLASTFQSASTSEVQNFSTPADLLEKLRRLATDQPCAIFHAAAVNDFGFGKIYEKREDGSLEELHSGKFSSRSERPLLAELVPTPKILPQLRDLFPRGFIVGWKYEVEGTLPELIAKARRQLEESRSDLCVMNGPAYGPGFGLLSPAAPESFSKVENMEALFEALREKASKYFCP